MGPSSYPPPDATHRPFESHAMYGPTPGRFQSFLPDGISHAVTPVFSEELNKTLPAWSNATRWTWSPYFVASELSARYMSRTTLPVERSNRRTSCEVRPPASHRPSADWARQLMPPRCDR